MSRRILVSLASAAVFLAAGVGIFLALRSLKSGPERGRTARPSVVVRVRPAVRTVHTEWLSGYGESRALARSRVAAEVTGVVTWVSPRLESGFQVKGHRLVDGTPPDAAEAPPGEALVHLDDRDLVQAHEDAKARQAQAVAARTRADAVLASVRKRHAVARRDYAIAQDELTRVESLLATGDATASERDRQRLETTLRERSLLDLEGQEATADADVVRAKADVTAAEARTAIAKLELDRAVVRAPFAGRIEARHVQPGDRVAPGTVLFDIVDPSRVEIAVALGASRFGDVEVGAPARVRLAEDGPVLWSGRVARLAATVEPTDRTFLAYLVVSTKDGTPAVVPPGTFVVALIQGPSYEGVIPLPRTAFLQDRIYIAKRDETGEAVVEERTPSIRRRLSDVILLDGGVEPGEEIVLTNLEQLANGSRVRIAADEPAEAASR